LGGGGVEVGDGDAGDLGEGFVGEEGLMRGDEDVGEGEEAGEFVILEAVLGVVLKKDAFLFFIHIQGDATKMASL
jgi:hypothetical protein